MTESREPAPERAHPEYVVVSTSSGLLLGLVEQESASGRIALRRPDGSVEEVEPRGRVTPAADPALLPPIPFTPPEEEGERGLARMLALFREEPKTADDRRAWALRHVASQLPEGKEVDELVRFRYEEHRAARLAVLRQRLEAAREQGDERLLLMVLEPGVPTDARRLAMAVAVAGRTSAAVPALCAAALHKTQLAFAREAIGALAVLAPERLPLIARAVTPEVRNAIDMRAIGALPEAEALARRTGTPWAAVLDDAGASDAPATDAPASDTSASAPEEGSAPVTTSATDDVVAGGGATELLEVASEGELRPESLLHLTLALPARSQVRLLAGTDARDGGGAVGGMLRQAAAASFREIAGKESPTGYELLVRMALAQLILSDDDDDLADLRREAARSIVRDGDVAGLRELAVVLPERSVVRLVAASLAGRRGDHVGVLLATLASDRPGLAPALGRRVREALNRGDLDSRTRVSALRLLAADTASRSFVAREAMAVLGREPLDQSDELASALARYGVLPDLRALRPAGLVSVIQSLPHGSADYAARVLVALEPEDRTAEGGAAVVWGALNALELPESWVAEDRDFRRALRAWLPTAAANQPSEALRRTLFALLATDAPEEWPHWSESDREAAFHILQKASAQRAAVILTAIAAPLEPAAALRQELVRRLASDIIGRSPDVLESVTATLSADELRGALLARGAELEQRLAERRAALRQASVTAAERLSADLRREVERALHAIGREDQLGVLLARLAEDIASSGAGTAEPDPEVADYLASYPAAASDATAEALLAALRRISGRSRSSHAARTFFEQQVERLLAGMSREDLEAFTVAQRRALDRLDLAAVEPVAVALLQRGANIATVWELLGGGSTADARSAIEVALRTATEHPETALSLLEIAGADLPTLATAVAARTTVYQELLEQEAAATGGLADLARRLAPTLEAIEGVFLNYARVRRALSAHGLVPVEPILGASRPAAELVPGAHRVLGVSVTDGEYEVHTQGIRLGSSGDVLTPAIVARRGDADSLAEGATAPRSRR